MGIAAPPRPASLLSLDYSGPEVCGGQPCFSDEMLDEMMEREQEQLLFDATVAALPAPIAEVGPFQVSVGSLSNPLRLRPAGPRSLGPRACRSRRRRRT